MNILGLKFSKKQSQTFGKALVRFLDFAAHSKILSQEELVIVASSLREIYCNCGLIVTNKQGIKLFIAILEDELSLEIYYSKKELRHLRTILQKLKGKEVH